MRESAGVLLWRRRGGRLEVLLVHPGGPFWARKDAGAWSIPKGEVAPGEDHEATARRELAEELGLEVRNELEFLATVRQRGGKLVHAFMLETDLDPATIRSNSFELEWPPRSGKRQRFPEVDRAAWFGPNEAWIKIIEGQRPLLEKLAQVRG